MPNMTLTVLEKAIFKHASRGILVDTNLLLLFLIGIFGENHIKEFKKIQKYSIEDFNIVNNIIRRFSRINVTPQILAEISNLSKQMYKSNLKQYFLYLIDRIRRSKEIYINKNDLLLVPELLPKYGFTDLSILESAKVTKCLVFTDDFQLVGFLRKKKVVVINLNEIRTELWFT